MSVGEFWWLLFVSWMLLGAYFDFSARRIPNKLVVCAIAGQLGLLGYAMLAGLSVPGANSWLPAVLGLVAGMAFLVFWSLKVMGGGDVKFLAALGFWVGVGPLVPIVLLGSVLAMGHALLQLFLPFYLQIPGLQRRGRRDCPYAGYLAIAAISVALMPWNFPSCSWFSSSFCTRFSPMG